jgi:hypothetical protein
MSSALSLQSIVKRFFALMGYGGEAAAAAVHAAAARREAAGRAQFASSAAPRDYAEARVVEELHALAARRCFTLDHFLF